MKNPIPYTPPTFKSNGFNCPFCHAYADQRWGTPQRTTGNTNYGASDDFWICRCHRCEKFSIWIAFKMVHPRVITTPAPNEDLSEDIKFDYEEARAILGDSPRGAAALLRLSIQKLCKELGMPGNNINEDIKELVKIGLPIQIQQSLDIVRVVGNNAVHPGQIDLRDDIDTANKLFGLVNLISNVMISQPKHVKSLFETIVPEDLRNAIEKRDKPK